MRKTTTYPTPPHTLLGLRSFFSLLGFSVSRHVIQSCYVGFWNLSIHSSSCQYVCDLCFRAKDLNKPVKLQCVTDRT